MPLARYTQGSAYICMLYVNICNYSANYTCILYTTGACLARPTSLVEQSGAGRQPDAHKVTHIYACYILIYISYSANQIYTVYTRCLPRPPSRLARPTLPPSRVEGDRPLARYTQGQEYVCMPYVNIYSNSSAYYIYTVYNRCLPRPPSRLARSTPPPKQSRGGPAASQIHTR